MNHRAIFSPLVVFLGLLALFELGLRLPFALYVRRTPATGVEMHVHYFSIQNPDEVIILGITIVLLAVAAGFVVAVISGTRIVSTWRPGDFPHVPRSAYLLGVICAGSVFLAVAYLGWAALITDISGKRSELGDYGLIWFLLKIGNFSHAVAALLFVRMRQTGALTDRIIFSFMVLTLIVSSIVFSQRALLVSFLLELVYLQLILGSFRLRRMLWIFTALVVTGILISALRPSAATMSFGEALVFGAEKLLQSRYFLDFSKLGTVTLWADSQPWLGPVMLGFVLEPFLGDQVIFYKELGSILAREAYLYSGAFGITPGVLLEAILSFGLGAGIVVFAGIFYLFMRLERSLFAGGPHSLFKTMAILLVISKFSLMLNSSMGAFAFQLLLEMIFLAASFAILHIFTIHRTSPEPEPQPGRRGDGFNPELKAETH